MHSSGILSPGLADSAQYSRCVDFGVDLSEYRSVEESQACSAVHAETQKRSGSARGLRLEAFSSEAEWKLEMRHY